MEHEELLSVIEAILFAAGDPVPASRIALVTGEETQTIVSAARSLPRRMRKTAAVCALCR